MKDFCKNKTWLILILFLAVSLRCFGLNWDQNQHLHPDERFLTMVATAIEIPRNLAEYLNPQKSHLSPYNVGYPFFVYGTFPLYLIKILGEVTHLNTYETLPLLGRTFSAFFDIGVVFLIYQIGKKIYGEKAGQWGAFFYSLMALPIQLSHFFTVDTFLNFFLFLAFFFLILLSENFTFWRIIGLGTAFGLALACKISALYFLPIIGLAFLFQLTKKNFWHLSAGGSAFLLISLLVFRFNQPSAFANSNFLNWQPNPQLIANLRELKTFDQPDSWYPPSLQWRQTTPWLFPLKNLLSWGLGWELGIISVMALLFTLSQTIKKKAKPPLTANWLILVWVLGLFIYQGGQYCKTMRYFLPLYPYLALISGLFVSEIFKKTAPKSKTFNLALQSLLITLSLIYPLSFMAIYTRPVTRVQASSWIYQNIPAGAKLAAEYWDDPLPLHLPGFSSSYQIQMLSLFDEESPQKWTKIKSQLAQTDYIILSSNRLYGSIPQNPDRYFQTAQYYRDLFSGQLGFLKVAEFTSYPCFPPIGPKLFCFKDDQAEEAFTVYDHPKVIIFQKQTSSFSQKQEEINRGR